MRALDDLRRAIVTPNAFDQFLIGFAGALGDENVTGPAQIPRRFAQCSARQKKFISERRLPIDQHNIEPMLQMEILQTVIEQQGIGFPFFDREEAALYPILVDEHDHIFQVMREHVRFVSRGQRIEQQCFAIGNDPWRIGIVAA